MRAGEILDDRYVLDRVLGQGGMGVVWVARDRTNGERVAIKLLLDDIASGNTPAHEDLRKELRHRFRREAEACLKLAHHPNVVRVLEFSEKETDDLPPYIVMELLEGASLQDFLKRKRSLEPKLAARIAADVASCLTSAHAMKLVHRDLKPANIYLHRTPGMDEDEFVTKVLDFGVCKDGDSVEVASGNMQTKTGMVVGSIAYMSPQQALGSKNVDFRTDLWSVGVMLYELVTGLRAFSGDVNDILKVYAPMLVGKGPNPPVPAPSSRTRGVPPELDAVVERCTKAKPADRYGSTEELARDLYAIAGLPVPVIPKARPSSTGKALIDLYEPAIIESKAVPAAEDKRRFSQSADTIPFKQPAEVRIAVPMIIEQPVSELKAPVIPEGFSGQTQVMDSSDTDKTLRMAPKNARATLPRPATVQEPRADAGTGTQLLMPGAPVASPMQDESAMRQALEEYRKSSTKIPIPDLSDLDAAGGTKMLMTPDVPPPKRSEPSATTSVAMSHSMPQSRLEQTIPLDPATTTGRRRRRTSPALLVLVGAGVLAALGLAVFLGMKQPAKTTQNSPPTSNSALPTPPMSSDATEPVAPVKVADTKTPPPEVPQPPPEATPAATPAPTPTPTTTTPTGAIAAHSPTGTTTTVKPLGTPPTPPPPPTSTNPLIKKAKTPPVCTGVGVFKRCK